MKKVAVLVPIYKPQLQDLELFTLKFSLDVLKNRDVIFFGPEQLDRAYYDQNFGPREFVGFPPAHFQSLLSYSNLLLTPAFYERFSDYEHLLLTQPDAIVLRDELDHWCAQPYDFVGAPWPNGFGINLNVPPFVGPQAKQVVVYVGNGGLSLRRVKSCISMLGRYPEIVAQFKQRLAMEDITFAVVGALTEGILIPNQMTASLFSLELRPSHYFALNGGKMPMGGHAWWSYEPQFWRPYLPPI